jgi:very-short-patch-repair endonuclease
VPALDRSISDLAQRQHGVFTARQVNGVGGQHHQVQYRVSTGDWLVLERGVYALASAPPTWRRQVMAAILGKRQAIASGLTAGSLHNIPSCRRLRPEITIPTSGNVSSSLATVRRRSDFDSIDKTLVAGIPAMSVAETLFDLAKRWPMPVLEGAVDHCLVRGAVEAADMQRVLDRVEGSRLKGIKRFRDCVYGIDSGYVPTESELERMLLRALDDPRVPHIDRQVRLAWWQLLPHRIDAVIEVWKLILEADGRTFHTKRIDFERDRQRDNLAVAHGYRVMRFTYRALVSDPDAVLALVLGAGKHA